MQVLIYSMPDFIKLKSIIHNILNLNENILRCSYNILSYAMGDLYGSKILFCEEIVKNIIRPYSQIISKEGILLEHAYYVIKTCQNIPLTSNDEYANTFKKQLECCIETCDKMRKTIREQESKLDILTRTVQPLGQAIIPLNTVELWLSKINLNQDIRLLKCVFDSFCDMEREIDTIYQGYIRLESELF